MARSWKRSSVQPSDNSLISKQDAHQTSFREMPLPGDSVSRDVKMAHRCCGARYSKSSGATTGRLTSMSSFMASTTSSPPLFALLVRLALLGLGGELETLLCYGHC